MSMTTVNANSTDAADAMALALTSTKNGGCSTTKAHISPDDLINDYSKLAVNDNYSLWMDQNTGTMSIV